jgi:sugar phosphate isomerase/epimerase
VQLYTVRDAVAADLDAALGRIAAIGFRTVELYGFVDRAPEYRDLLAKHGLAASSAHAPFLSQDAAPIDGTPALERFVELLDPEVILEVDTYWVEVGGGSAVETLGRLGDRVQFIHVKDGDISRDNTRQVAVGDGRMPVLDILAAAPQAVPVVELDDFDGDVFDALADSFAYLTSNGERA